MGVLKTGSLELRVENKNQHRGSLMIIALPVPTEKNYPDVPRRSYTVQTIISFQYYAARRYS